MDRKKVIKDLEAYRDRDFIREGKNVFDSDPRYRKMIINNALALLKEQEELLKHEYWRGYNNGRADERGLQDGTIMQTFSPD